MVGLDIGSTQIRAVVSRRNDNGQLSILGMGQVPSAGILQGNIHSTEAVGKAIRSAVQEAAQTAQVPVATVNVNLLNRHVQSNVHRGSMLPPKVGQPFTKKDIDTLLKDMYCLATPPGYEIIHIIPQTYSVTDQEWVSDPIGKVGNFLKGAFHVVTAPTRVIQNIHESIRTAGLDVAALIASSLAVLTQEEKETGVCLIDLGGSTASIAIFYENKLRHIASIPFGSDTITEDIRQGLAVSPAQAEALKVQFGKAIEEEDDTAQIVVPALPHRPEKRIPQAVLSRIIEARCEELIHLLHAEIVISGLQHSLASGIVLVGSGAQLPLIEVLFEYITGYPIRQGRPAAHLHQTDSPYHLGHASSLGLALAHRNALDSVTPYLALQKQHLPLVQDVSAATAPGFLQKLFQRATSLFSKP